MASKRSGNGHGDESVFLREYNDDPIKAVLSSHGDLHHAVEDSIRKIMTDLLKFEEDLSLLNLKLVLGYAACFLMLGGAGYSYLVSLQESKTVLSVCLIGYLVFSVLFFLVILFKEKNIIFSGLKNGKRIDVSLGVSRYSTKFTISTQWKGFAEREVTRDATGWFNENGEMSMEHLLKDFLPLVELSKL